MHSLTQIQVQREMHSDMGFYLQGSTKQSFFMDRFQRIFGPFWGCFTSLCIIQIILDRFCTVFLHVFSIVIVGDSSRRHFGQRHRLINRSMFRSVDRWIGGLIDFVHDPTYRRSGPVWSDWFGFPLFFRRFT